MIGAVMSGFTTERVKAVGIENLGVVLQYGGDNQLDLAWHVDLSGLPTAELINSMIAGGLATRSAPPGSIRIYVSGPNGEPSCGLTDVFDVREDGNYAPKILKQLEVRVEEYESFYSIGFQADRLEELDMDAQVVEIDEEMERESAAVFKLVDRACELAVKCLKDKMPFSMVGYSQRSDGEIITHLITSESDEEMFYKAQQALKLGPTVGFALIGEGNIGETKDTSLPSLICYYQHRSLESPVIMYRAYKKSFLGGLKFYEDSFRVIGYVDESWL